jgi:MoaA/NifB/PqqE/SkfB family radical SAM enzyme
MKTQEYVINKNKNLKGSGVLSNTREAKLDRESFMVEFMDRNLAFTNNIKSSKDILDYDNQLKLFKKKYLDYRSQWKNQPKEIIEKKITSIELKKHKVPPLCLDIEVASICDLACPFCFREFVATPDKIINEKLCLDLIDQAAEMGVPSIKFNWRGEPLLHPKLPFFIKYAKQKGILETIINTNATQLNEKKSKELIESGLDLIIYSFDGGSKETYEKNRPGRFKENKFEDVYQNIKTLKKMKDQLGSPFPFSKIQMILTEETFNEQENFFKLFDDFVDEVTVNQYTERGGNISDLDEKSIEEYNKIRVKYDLKDNSPYMRDPHGKIYVSKKRIPCEQPFQRLLVTYEGRVAMCCYDWGATHPVGYVNELAFNNKNSYDDVMKKVKDRKKGFELLENIKMPNELNEPAEKINSLSEIWYGKEIDNVRCKQISNEADKLEICKNCSFKDTFDWIC